VPNIIVGVDGSERAADAVALAARLAGGADAELLFACVYPYDDAPSRASNATYKRYLRDDALAALEQTTASITLPHRSVAIPEVTPAKAIQELAAGEEAALIVIGSSGRGAIGRVFAGTTAERLLHGAPCPVVVAPAGYAAAGDDIRTIGVGYDGTEEAEAALAAAVTLARALGARLDVVEVLDARWMGTPVLMAGPGFVVPTDELEARTRRHVREKVSELPSDVVAEPHVLIGTPEPELAQQTEQADLFVVGSRGYGPHRAVLLGSVSGRLVRDAACPVLVVPRGVAAPLAGLFPEPKGTRATA
jgi:nucleotide-binding universal stress UspA family protein